MGCLYKLTFSNGKSYIGYTTKSMSRRVKEHVKTAKLGGHLLVHKALRKFEFSFKAEEIFQSDIEQELLDEEVVAIAKHNTLAPGGYNLTTGGEKCYTLSDESKAKISNSMLGTKRRIGKRHSQEAKELMRKAKVGKALSSEQKLNMSMAAALLWAKKQDREFCEIRSHK